MQLCPRNYKNIRSKNNITNNHFQLNDYLYFINYSVNDFNCWQIYF